MQKIPTLFLRNDADHRICNEYNPPALWVRDGEGVATIKFDGTACLLRDGILYKRYDAKKGRTPPPDFLPAQESPDVVTGHWPGWVPVHDTPENTWYSEAVASSRPDGGWIDGTYELCGPKVQGNPEGFPYHVLIPHGKHHLTGILTPPRDFIGLRAYLINHPMEGIVWHRGNGNMAKIKAKDFGLSWPRKTEDE
jgi:hypothetical protein